MQIKSPVAVTHPHTHRVNGDFPGELWLAGYFITLFLHLVLTRASSLDKMSLYVFSASEIYYKNVLYRFTFDP